MISLLLLLAHAALDPASWVLSQGEADSLARYDLVMLSPRASDQSIEALRDRGVLVLGHVSGYGATPAWPGYLNGRIVQEADARGWWLRDAAGNRISEWCPAEAPSYALNLTIPACRAWMAQTLADSLARFDGIFLDETEGDLAWLAGQCGNGAPTVTAAEWSAAVREEVTMLRLLSRSGFVVVANGSAGVGSGIPALVDMWHMECFPILPPLYTLERSLTDSERGLYARRAAVRWHRMMLANQPGYEAVTESVAVMTGSYWIWPPWTGVGVIPDPVHHFVFGLAPGSYRVTQGETEIGNFTTGAAGDICFAAPYAGPVTIAAAGSRPSKVGVE